MTWGISGPTFLALYIAALVVVLVANIVLRRRLLHPRGSVMVAAQSNPLSVDELAYLSGGINGLGASALIGLRERGEVSSPKRRQVAAEPRTLDAGATPAQRALHAELRRTGSCPPRRVGQLIARTPVPAAIRSSLAGRGLITSRKLRTEIRLGTLGYVALLAVGAARVVDSVHNNRPVVDLLLLMAVTVVIALLSFQVPAVTPAGRAMLRHSRVEADTLRSASLPGDRALAVALFGIGALWLAEPAMADELGYARAQAISSGSDSSNWSDTSSSCGGSSSSCGGSSCGSSCGGGGCGG